MNERIRELAKQIGYGRDRWNNTEQFEEFLDKFGELLVRQCATVVGNVESGYRDYRSQIEETMRDDCVDALLHHWGIDK